MAQITHTFASILIDQGRDVGAIRVHCVFSIVEVAADLADGFAIEAAKPDPRNPRIA